MAAAKMGLQLILTIALFVICTSVTDVETFETKGRPFRIREKISDLQENVTNHAQTLVDLEKQLQQNVQTTQSLCIETEKRLLQVMRDHADRKDPIPPQEVKRLVLKNTAQDSSHDNSDNSHRAIDGNRNTYFPGLSCTHTTNDRAEHWWQAEIVEGARITKVTLYNRADCCAHRLANFRIEGFLEDPRYESSSTAQLCANNPGTLPAEATDIYCDKPTPAQYIRITHNAPSEALTLCETEVDGYPYIKVPDTQTLQSSSLMTEEFHTAWRASDGNSGTCSHTNFEDGTDPWWQVKLPEKTIVHGISITNRKDEKSAWLRDLEISVSEFHSTCAGVDVNSHVCATREDEIGKETVTFTCDPEVKDPVQYVLIKKKHTPNQALSLCEVNIIT